MSSYTEEYLNKNKTKLLTHSPKSNDLNHVEQVWSILKKKVEFVGPKNKL